MRLLGTADLRLAAARLVLRLALLVALVLTLPACAQHDFFVLGYHPYWMGDAYEHARLDAIDELLYFELAIEANGTFANTHGWEDRGVRMVETAHRSATRAAPSLTLFDAAVFTKLFTNPASVERLLQGTLAAVRNANADGVHLDIELFETVPPEARDAYTRFVADLSRTLGTGYTVTVFTLALDPADAYDEVGLAEAADYLVVQGYDLHHQHGDTAGPISALRGWGRLNWHAVLDRYDQLRVPRRQLVMAVPYFGYEWPTVTGEPGAATTGPGEIVAYAPISARVPEIPGSAVQRAAAFGMRRDPVSGSPFYAYRDAEGQWRQGWYEDIVSLTEKFDFVKRKQLGGIAIFPLGYDGGELTAAVVDAFPVAQRTQLPRPAGDAVAVAQP
ncbi:MAG: glycosyl hydrolase family 18 protein [Bacteroidota bacterium]